MAGVASAVPARAAEPAPAKQVTPGGTFLLTNVLLETGYEWDGDEVARTTTQKSAVMVKDGTITEILASDAAAPNGITVVDAEGMLLPSFGDMHIHLDKTFYGGPWVAPRRIKNGVAGQIQRELTLLPQLLPTLKERTVALMHLLQSNGTTFARSQCNVDPVIGTKHVEMVKHALDQHADMFGYEIVAFPQHGFLSANLVPIMRAAMEAGADYVGGIDPTKIDGGMEASVDAMMQIALGMNKGVDIHLHEPGPSGIAALLRIADTIEREPSLTGRVNMSHCYCLMSLPEADVADIATRMAEMQMSLATAVPIGPSVMPIPILIDKGVSVYTGTDSVIDHWSVFGTGDVLGKANLACQIYGWEDELSISQSLRLATGGPTPLNAAGEQVWPKPGDAADMVLMPASCSAEAVARLSPRVAVFHAGNLAAEA